MIVKKSKMEDKKIELTEAILSIKRIEYLLEEVIFQSILSRGFSAEEANEKFKLALTNVDNIMKSYIQLLPPSQ